MTRGLKLLFTSLFLSLSSLTLLAQDYTTSGGEEGAAAALCGCGFMVVAFLVGIGINVAIGLWINKDAKSRGMENATLWMWLGIIFGLLPLIIYIFTRPKEKIVP